MFYEALKSKQKEIRNVPALERSSATKAGTTRIRYFLTSLSEMQSIT